MKRTFVLSLIAALFLLLLGTVQCVNGQEKSSTQPPAQALIQGVPFVSFAEASRLKYPDDDVINPAYPATMGMLYQYWGQKLSLVTKKDGAESLEKKGWILHSKEAQNLEELKSFVARGIPVNVFAAVTPFGHYLNPPVAMILAITSEEEKLLEKLDKENHSTQTLGRVIPLDAFPKIKALTKWEGNPINEVALNTPCVLIGYDDTRRVLTLHSPSFGPAWEVSFDDFMKMWNAYDRKYFVLHPPDYAEFLAKRPTPAPYRERTPGERAAVHFLYGYALSSIGKAAEAEAAFQKGMALPDIGPGYQHLFLMEIATLYHAQKLFDTAIETLQKATKLVPENGMAWLILSHMYQEPGIPDGDRKGNEAEEKAAKLQRDRKALETTAKVLPRDFWILYLSPVRGWAYR